MWMFIADIQHGVYILHHSRTTVCLMNCKISVCASYRAHVSPVITGSEGLKNVVAMVMVYLTTTGAVTS